MGLKTGSTSLAKFCLSAVAKRDGITLISVVMAAPDYKARLKDASAMLNYGFSKCSLYTDEDPPKLSSVTIKKGVEKEAEVTYKGGFQYLRMDGKTIGEIKKELNLPKEVPAPVKKGEKAGELYYYMDGEKIGTVDVLYAESVRKATYADCLKTVLGLL